MRTFTIDQVRDIVKDYEEYIELLGKELSELVVAAHNRGWRSSLIEEGEAGRKKLDEHRNLLKE